MKTEELPFPILVLLCILILVLMWFITGCTVTANKQNDKMVLKGWGAKKAVFKNGSSIEKEEPIKTPDIFPMRQP